MFLHVFACVCVCVCYGSSEDVHERKECQHMCILQPHAQVCECVGVRMFVYAFVFLCVYLCVCACVCVCYGSIKDANERENCWRMCVLQPHAQVRVCIRVSVCICVFVCVYVYAM